MVNNYIASIGGNDKISYLILGYNENHEFRFVDLKTGMIFNQPFSSVDEAESWLYLVAKVHLKNGIETTYVP